MTYNLPKRQCTTEKLFNVKNEEENLNKMIIEDRKGLCFMCNIKVQQKIQGNETITRRRRRYK